MRYRITATLFLLGALIYAANHLGFFASSFANIRGTEIETIALKDLNGNRQAFSQLYGDETVVYFLRPGARLATTHFLKLNRSETHIS